LYDTRVNFSEIVVIQPHQQAINASSLAQIGCRLILRFFSSDSEHFKTRAKKEEKFLTDSEIE
jgi:hypothetical protein